MLVPKELKFDDNIKSGKIKAPYAHKKGLTFVFLDTETKINFKSENASDYLKLGVLGIATYDVNGVILFEEYTHFNTNRDLHKMLTNALNKYGYLNLVAHNISFDFQVVDLIKWLETTNTECDLWYQEMSVSFISWKNKKKQIKILDNMNWFPMALKQEGKIIGIEKMEIDFETCTDQYLAKYCEQDVKIMIHGLSMFWQMINELFGIRPRWTLGSTAMNCFMSTPERLKLRNNRLQDVNKDAIRSYFGGRVEVFRVGEFKNETLYKLDVNSLYPTVMAKEKYPTEYAYSMEKPNLQTAKKVIELKAANALVNIKTKVPVFPVKVDKRNIYPIGTYKTWLTGNELKYAINNDLITSVEKIHAYHQDYIFSKFINKLYMLKQQYSKEGNYGGREVCKRLMNSLYGKFAQLGYTREFIGNDYKQKYVRGKVVMENREDNYQFEVLNYKRYKLNKDMMLIHSFPLIASCVTSNARQYMWQIFNEIGWENCYYSDTDSIITNKIGLERVKGRLDDYLLGALKNEGESNYVQIYGSKAYIWGDKRTIKGIPYRAHKLNDNTFVYTGFRTLNNMVFDKANMHEFEMHKERKIRELLPVGYSKIGSRVYPPVLYDGVL